MQIFRRIGDTPQSCETTASHDFGPHLGAKRIVFRNVPGSEGHLQKNMGHSTNYPTQAGERPYPLHPALSPPTSALEIVTPRVLEPYHLHPALSPPTSVLEFVTPRVLEPFSSQHRIGRVNHRSSASPPIFPPDPPYCTSPFNNPGVLLPLTRWVRFAKLLRMRDTQQKTAFFF